MNRIFRVVWNASLGVWQAVGEIGKGTGKGTSQTRKNRTKKSALALSLFISGGQLYAAVLPEGAQVTAGSAAISTNGNTLNVVQSSDKAAINWQSFNIGKDATVHFQQPSAGSVALNRVVGNEQSVIEGALKANGQIFLLNSNGVLFTKDAQVNTGGIVASTLNFSDADFMAGKTQLSANGSKASVINLGTITAKDGGYVALLGNQVKNEGVITATLGTAVMAAGDKVSLNFNGNSLVGVTVDQGTLDALVTNKNAIVTDGGLVVLTAKGIDQVMAGVVNNSGEIKANSIVEKGGKIYLMGDDITNSGKLSADGKTGGGEILVGGDWQGANADKFPHATKVTLTETSDISANATQQGDGGKIVAWSNVHDTKSVTKIAGKLSAEAKGANTKGGKIETSGHHLNIAKDSSVKTNGGEWLLDPLDITIDATLVTAIQSALSSGDVTITTDGNNTPSTTSGESGSTGNITLTAELGWCSDYDLTLSAARNIYIQKNITANGSAAKLNLYYGQDSVTTNNTANYYIQSAKVDLKAGQNFSTKLGNNGAVINYIVITSLGSAGDEISNPGNSLQGLANSANLSGNFALGANLDASSTSTWNSGAGFKPIGSSWPSFTGKLDGLGHAIDGLVINRSNEDNVGLIGYARNSASLSNIKLTNVNISGKDKTGSLLGYLVHSLATDRSVINNVSSSGYVAIQNGGIFGGGLIGAIEYPAAPVASSLNISNSYSSVNLTSTGVTVPAGGFIGGIGGFIGKLGVTGTITNSFAEGSVTTDGAAAGGFIGYLQKGTITNSYASGNISRTGSQLSNGFGGFVGSTNSGTTINNSYASGNLLLNTVGSQAGGFVGANYSGTISYSYALGNVTGIDWVAGFSGVNFGTISQSYAIGIGIYTSFRSV